MMEGTMSHLLGEVRRITIRTRRLVDTALAGDYLSLYKGRGIEFYEMREYQPGDDVRSIDWNVTARVGIPYVRRYIEEKELPVMLLVDGSGSGLFGTGERRKREVMIQVSAFLAMAALKENSPFGMLIFTDRVEVFHPMRKGKGQFYRILRSLIDFDPEGMGTDISLALDTFGRIARRRSIVFLISDLIGEGYRRSLAGVAKRHDLIPVVVRDRREAGLPPVGIVELLDLETGERVIVDTGNRDVLREINHRLAEEEGRLEGMLRSLGLDSIRLDTEGPFLRALGEFFMRRRDWRRRSWL